MTWQPRVERRDHPFGEQGVRSSLEEVAKRAAAGGSHPRVKEWAGEQVHDARLRGLGVKGDRARAEILLSTVQKYKTWVPDPVGVEYIKGAHLLACAKDDKHGPCFNSGDCFAEGTLVFREGEGTTLVEKLHAGDRIWGLNDWSTVEAVVDKGELPVDVVHLSNLIDLRLTSGHKVYVQDEDGERRVRVCELQRGDRLSQPNAKMLWKQGIERIDYDPIFVRSVEREAYRDRCWDIQTSDHRVYLFGNDVTVSNCDDLCVLLAASFLSVGLHTMIVGHAYNSAREIQHVLCAARVRGEWLYADPSYDFPLGRCEPFSRERLLSVPSVKVVCDETACLTNPTNFDPDRNGFVDRGFFVGVDGAPEHLREIWWIGPGRRA